MIDDASLIARVLTRDDHHAFATLVRRHQDAVRRLLRRLTAGDHAFADDLAQETFLRAYRGLKSFTGQAQLSSWLYRIAYNVFLSARPKPAPAPERPEPSPEPDPLMNARLERAMAALKPEERLALTLAFANGMNTEEIAHVLECPEGTVKTHLHRGKEKLRKELTP